MQNDSDVELFKDCFVLWFEIDCFGPSPTDIEGCESPDAHFKVVASPRPNKSYSFVREPPDGCEKIRVITEHAEEDK